MKKSLLALAVLGAFAGAASAQSNVTLYGRVDLSVTRNTGTDYWQMQNGSGSRLGVRGAEDLGGGLKAIFNIEHRFDADTGTQSAAAFWTGRSYVGLAGDSWGQVTLGREYTPLFLYVALPADPWGFDTVVTRASAEGRPWGLLGGIAGSRKDNTINYSSPNLSGFRGHVQWSMDETAGNDSNGTFGFALTYAAGPLSVGYGYDRQFAAGAAEEDPNYHLLQGSYDFGMFKLIGGFGRGEANTGDKHRDIHIAGTMKVGVGEARVAYNQLRNTDADGDARKLSSRFGLGYHHPLSKRTTVYTDLAREGEETDDKWGLDIGIKHNF